MNSQQLDHSNTENVRRPLAACWPEEDGVYSRAADEKSASWGELHHQFASFSRLCGDLLQCTQQVPRIGIRNCEQTVQRPICQDIAKIPRRHLCRHPLTGGQDVAQLNVGKRLSRFRLRLLHEPRDFIPVFWIIEQTQSAEIEGEFFTFFFGQMLKAGANLGVRQGGKVTDGSGTAKFF